MADNTRMAYFDNLRSLVIFLVIVVHAASTYSGIGTWYYQEVEYKDLHFVDYAVYGTVSSFAQAWFMGLMFFIAAYWAANSLQKHGTVKFLKSKFLRLGVPLLAYVLVILPFTRFVIVADDGRTWEAIKDACIDYYQTFRWLKAAGPLWFVEALLIFCIIYAAFRALFPRRDIYRTEWLNNRRLVIIVVALTLISFVLRIWVSIEDKLYVFLIAFFPAYIALFIMGIIAGERKSLDYIAAPKNIKLCVWVICTCVPLWIFIMIPGGALQGLTYHAGGWHWQSFLYALWEICFSILFNIGLVAFFKKHVNISNKFTRLLAENSFGVYVFHALFVTLFPVLIKDLQVYTLIKFFIIIIATSVSTLAFTVAVRKIKIVKKIL
ncbi:MAG: acyltransferase [Clostridiales Family XIII bacterium]|nr:acyltransferase [Clostridiales Family XIII bacterium]